MIIKNSSVWYCLCHPMAIHFPITFNGACGFCRTVKVLELPKNVIKGPWIKK